MTARADRFFLLDSLRGVAALMVLSIHVTWFSRIGAPERWFNPPVARLEAAFAIFFVISGFLLYRPFVKARVLDRPALSTKAYGWRRFLRIVPAFWVALTLIALIVGPDITSFGQFVRNYGFLQLYFPSSTTEVIPQAWTLSVEVAFYALLPVWAWLMRRLLPKGDVRQRIRGELLAVSGLILLSLLYTGVFATFVVDRVTFAPVPLLAALPGYMDHIGLGMLLAVVSVWIDSDRRAQLPRLMELLARRPAVAWALAIATMIVGSFLLGDHNAYTPAQYMVRHGVNSIVAVAVVIPAVFGNLRQGATRRILGTPVLVYLGVISYGFYLYHWAVLRQILGWQLDGKLGPMSSWEWLAWGLAGAVVFGSLSWYLVERPALSLKRLVPGKPRDPPKEAASEPAPATTVT